VLLAEFLLIGSDQSFLLAEELLELPDALPSLL
jgi:hypothetical protein